MIINHIKKQTIINGDCLEVMKQIEGQQFKACITDPPYYIAFEGSELKNSIRTSGRNKVISAKWDKFDSLDEFKEFTSKWLKLLYRIMSLKSNIFMFFSYIHRDWIIQAIKETGFKYRKPLIFYKPDTMGIFPNSFGYNYEDIYWFTKNENAVNEKYYLKIPTTMRDVFTYNSTNNKYREECGFHPTAKPLRLITDLLSVCTKENDKVIDPFVGSGTTLKACEIMGRYGTGIEISPEYIETIKSRLNKIPQKFSLFC